MISAAPDASGPISAGPAPAPTPAPTTTELFTGFLTLGLTGFGGVLPLARRMLVEKRGWLTGGEFADLLSLCQFLPGGNIVNLSIAVGMKFRGAPGAVASIVGLIAAPTAIVIGLGVFYDRFADDPVVARMFAGLAAAAAGLLLSMAIKLAWPLRTRPGAVAIAAICVLAIAVLRLPLVAVMLVMAPLSILASWWSSRR